MMVHICNLNAQEAEVGKTQGHNQPGLPSESEARLGVNSKTLSQTNKNYQCDMCCNRAFGKC